MRAFQTHSINRLRHFGLRWLTLYVVAYIFFGNYIVGEISYLIPWLSWLFSALESPSRLVVPWLAQHILGHSILVLRSGDDLFSYITVGLLVILTSVCAGVWTMIDGGLPHQESLYRATSVLARYSLALAMFGYGFMKIFGAQFTPMWPIHLMEPLGDFRPNGLMWAFMGYSYLYGLFGGLAEVTGGILVLFPRTTTLGALIIAAVMANVLIMDVSYFVVVRIGAANLLIMGVFLLLPGVKKLMSSILGDRLQRKPRTSRSEHLNKWLAPAIVCVKVLVIAVMVYYPAMLASTWARARAVDAHAPMVGLYQVDGFKTGYPRFKDGNAWVLVGIEAHAGWDGEAASAGRDKRGYVFAVRAADDTLHYYSLEIDSNGLRHGLFTLAECYGYICLPNPSPQKTLHMVLHYHVDLRSMENSDVGSQLVDITLTGTVYGKPIVMTLRQKDISAFTLVRTPFHFIQPDNDVEDI